MQTPLGTSPDALPMSYDLEHILSLDEWTDSDRDAVRLAVQADPDLRQALQRWFVLSAALSERWHAHAPSRYALVLLACKDRWNDTDLSNDERSQLEDAASCLEQAAGNHSAVTIILDRIARDAVAFDSAWNEAFVPVSRGSDRGPLRQERATARPLRLVRLAMAAAAVVALILVGRNVLTPDGGAPFAVYSPEDAMQKVTLVDGTEVRLATGSRLDVFFDLESQERRVLFEGSAFFDVAEGPRTFRVETANAVTTALGTSFGVHTESGTDVTLVSGRVSIASIQTPDHATILTPGDQGRLPVGASDVEVQSFSQLEGFDFAELLVFLNTPMREVVQRLTEEFEVSITVSEDLSEAPLTGTFESERGTKAILQIIVAALGANLDESQDGSFHISEQK